jgi:uncharacterized damage-inducible protein DinB
MQRLILIAAILLGTALCFAQEKSAPAKPTAAESKSDDRAATLVKEWTRARLGAQEYLDAMPEESIGFKPTAEIRSFAEQYLHIASANYAFASAASGRSNPFDAQAGKDIEKKDEPKQSKAALKKVVLDSYDFMIDAIKSIDPKTFEDRAKLFSFEMSRYLMINKALEHHAHHRGQSTIYLRLKGIKPPSERLF